MQQGGITLIGVLTHLALIVILVIGLMLGSVKRRFQAKQYRASWKQKYRRRQK